MGAGGESGVVLLPYCSAAPREPLPLCRRCCALLHRHKVRAGGPPGAEPHLGGQRCWVQPVGLPRLKQGPQPAPPVLHVCVRRVLQRDAAAGGRACAQVPCGWQQAPAGAERCALLGGERGSALDPSPSTPSTPSFPPPQATLTYTSRALPAGPPGRCVANVPRNRMRCCASSARNLQRQGGKGLACLQLFELQLPRACALAGFTARGSWQQRHHKSGLQAAAVVYARCQQSRNGGICQPDAPAGCQEGEQQRRHTAAGLTLRCAQSGSGRRRGRPPGRRQRGPCRRHRMGGRWVGPPH